MTSPNTIRPKLIRRNEGASSVEYAALIGLAAAGIVGSALLVGSGGRNAFSLQTTQSTGSSGSGSAPSGQVVFTDHFDKNSTTKKTWTFEGNGWNVKEGRLQAGFPNGAAQENVSNQFMMCEPLRGWRHVRVTARRTRRDYAECIRELVEVHYPRAWKIRLVQDNLNTHSGGSLYEAFAPEKARRLLDKVEFHYTPKHGSWLNMAETEISIMNRQCLDCRMDCQTKVATAVANWESPRNVRQVHIHWTFTVAAARRKLRKIYPSIED